LINRKQARNYASPSARCPIAGAAPARDAPSGRRESPRHPERASALRPGRGGGWRARGADRWRRARRRGDNAGHPQSESCSQVTACRRRPWR